MSTRPISIKGAATPSSSLAATAQANGDLPQITVQVADGMIVIAAVGRIGQFIAAELRDDLLQVWPACAGVLAVDLSACTYLSVDAVRTLQEIWRRPTPAGGELRVLANHPDVVTALANANIPRIRASGSSAPRGSTVATSTAAPISDALHPSAR